MMELISIFLLDILSRMSIITQITIQINLISNVKNLSSF